MNSSEETPAAELRDTLLVYRDEISVMMTLTYAGSLTSFQETFDSPVSETDLEQC